MENLSLIFALKYNVFLVISSQNIVTDFFAEVIMNYKEEVSAFGRYLENEEKARQRLRNICVMSVRL